MKMYALFFMLCCTPCVWGAESATNYKITVKGDQFTSKILPEFSRQYQHYYTAHRPAGHLPENLQVEHDQNSKKMTWILQEQRRLCTSQDPRGQAPKDLSHDFLATFIPTDSQDGQEKLLWAYHVDPTTPNLVKTVQEESYQEQVNLPCSNDFKKKGIFKKFREMNGTDRNKREAITQKSFFDWWKKVEVYDLSTKSTEWHMQNITDHGFGTLHKKFEWSKPVKENVRIENHKRTTFAKTVIASTLLATAAAAWKCYNWVTNK